MLNSYTASSSVSCKEQGPLRVFSVVILGQLPQYEWSRWQFSNILYFLFYILFLFFVLERGNRQKRLAKSWFNLCYLPWLAHLIIHFIYFIIWLLHGLVVRKKVWDRTTLYHWCVLWPKITDLTLSFGCFLLRLTKKQFVKCFVMRIEV